MTTKAAPTTVPNAPPLVATRREFGDFDEFAEAIYGWGLDWVQLDRGSLKASLRQAVTPSAVLARFRFSRKFHQRGTSPPGVRTFGFTGERSPDVEWRGQVGTSDHIVAFPANDEFEVVSHPGFHGDTVSISEDRIRSVAEYTGVPDPLEHLPGGLTFVASDPRRLAALRNAVSKVHATVPAHAAGSPDPSLAFEMEFDIVTALVSALEPGESADSGSLETTRRARAIRRALDYIEDHADEPPSVQAICSASGVSWRTLDYAFRYRFGVTPKQYLQATRLQRVRQEILNAHRGASILEIAARWGFWHMGQFAADYRRQFGELPSETVRQVGSLRSPCARSQ